MKTRFEILASTIAPLAAACGLALAASDAPLAAQVVSVDVAYADLDLTSPQGQSALAKRIDSAARHICGDGQRRSGTRIVDNATVAAAGKVVVGGLWGMCVECVWNVCGMCGM